MGTKAGVTFLATILCIFASSSHASDVKFDGVSLVNGLSWTFYRNSCPNLESIVKERIDFYLSQNITQAAGILRLQFHDCFVQGCEASVLLDGSPGNPGEKDALPNKTLRPEAFTIINDIKQRVEAACTGLVSCADILTLAVRDSVSKAGGPNYPVPLGRRDGLNFASQEETFNSLPPPIANVTDLMKVLSKMGLNIVDLVALSGAHTVGIAHCSSFMNRLYDRLDPTMEKNFGNSLRQLCPKVSETDNPTNLDRRTPNTFDNKYYVDLVTGQGLFTSDQALFTDLRTRLLVQTYALSQISFFTAFSQSIIKLSQVNVLTGSEGEIRKVCNVPNPTTAFSHPSIESVVNPDLSSSSSM